MPLSFLALAQQCAPMADPAAIAAVVSLESGFNPLAIRVNSDVPLERLPASKDESIQVVSALLAEKNAQLALGLGGVSVELGRMHGLSISDLFDPCSNLTITGKLLDGYLRASRKTGEAGFAVAFASYFGEGDAEAGYVAGYDKQALEAMAELKPRLNDLTLTSAVPAPTPSHKGAVAPARPVSAPALAAPPSSSPSWDVFGSAMGREQILIFSK